MENTSGQGKKSIVPDEIKGWNWSAFLLGWIWGIGNHVWVALLTLIPVLSIGFIMAFASNDILIPALISAFGFLLIMSIVIGAKGNEWAWKNDNWKDIEQFKNYQKVWRKYGITIIIVGWLLLFVITTTFSLKTSYLIRESPAGETEAANIQKAVNAIMADNGILTLPNPQTVATNNMNDFPTPNANNTTDEYVLFTYNGTTSYLVTQFTKGTYTAAANGKVTQVTTGYDDEKKMIKARDINDWPWDIFLLSTIIFYGAGIAVSAYMKVTRKVVKL